MDIRLKYIRNSEGKGNSVLVSVHGTYNSSGVNGNDWRGQARVYLIFGNNILDSPSTNPEPEGAAQSPIMKGVWVTSIRIEVTHTA